MWEEKLLIVFSLATLLWILFEWFVFRIRIDFALPRASVERTISDRKGVARTIWVGRPFEVNTTVTLPSFAAWLPTYVELRDLIPVSADLVEGRNGIACLFGLDSPKPMTCTLRTTMPGMIRFTGVRVVCSDLHGFFHAERFLPHASAVRVLPQPIEAGLTNATRKQNNSLLPPGMHYLARGGVGSELLEIRDYVPGDPPRSIAWKVSARRDVLMCKEFESEVPVRCQFMIDMSRSVRLGYPGPCEAARFVQLTATLGQTFVQHRDPVGLTIFDGKNSSYMPASAGRQTVVQMLDRLAKAMDGSFKGKAKQITDPIDAPPAYFLGAALDLAKACYPRALDKARELLFGRLFPIRGAKRQRIQVAAFLAAYFELDAMSIGELQNNDERFATLLQEFLSDHHLPYVGPLVDSRGDYFFDDREKVGQLASLLTRSVAKSRDNELFVLMAGLVDTDYDLGPLLKAIRVAVARHHRVCVLCAWPPGTVPPRNDAYINQLLDNMNGLPINTLASAAEVQHRHQNFHRLRSQLGKLRVPLVAATDKLANQLIVNQMELVKNGRVTA